MITFPPHTILAAYRGSIAHNMYVPQSDPKQIDDIDLFGICIGEPQHYFGLQQWGSRGTKEEWQGQFDCVWYEIRKAFSLLMQGNPNVLGLLWLKPEHYLHLDICGKHIIASRDLFVGKHVYHAFAGYASAQLQKMTSREPAEVREYLAVTKELKHRGIHPTDQVLKYAPLDTGEARDVANWPNEKLLQRLTHFHKKGENLGYLGDKRKQLLLEHGYDSKNAAHCIRLLKMCVGFLRSGEMEVFRVHDRQELLDIKAGKWELKAIKAYAENLFAQAKGAYALSTLPETLDKEKIETLLIDIVRREIDIRSPKKASHVTISIPL